MKEIIQKMKSYMVSFSFDDLAIRRFSDNWFIKLKRNNSSEYQPPKKRRSRTKKENQTVLPREKTFIKTFPPKFTPKSTTKVAHALGRKKQWVIEQQKRLGPDNKLLTNRPKFKMVKHWKFVKKMWISMRWKRGVGYVSELWTIQISHWLFEVHVQSAEEGMSRFLCRELEMYSLLVSVCQSFHCINEN